MTREQIEKAAGEYSGSVLGFKDNPVVMNKHKAFMDGAQWRINSVWHNMNEKPNGMFVILADFGQEEYSLGINLEGMESAKRWAYVSDLLPEKKEGWVNVYKERIYSTKEEAIEATYDGVTYVDTVKVCWEE